MRWIAILLLGLVSVGCVQPPTSEKDVFEDIVQLTSGFSTAGDAQFSADMEWIIFQAIPPTETQYQLYIARLIKTDDRVTGIGHPIRITPARTQNSRGYFSSDGVSVIFASTAGRISFPIPQSTTWLLPETMEIFRADAWQAAIAATEFSRGINLAKHPLTNNAYFDGECAFSPDGKWIIFTSTRDGDPKRTDRTPRDADVYVMGSDGSKVTRLTTSDGYDGAAVFSPDGTRICFRSDRARNGQIGVRVADLVFSEVGEITGIARDRAVTTDPVLHFGPTWHPDGLHLVYAARVEGRQEYELQMIRVDGTRQLRLTFTDGPDLQPVFSPDGKYLMWTSKRTADGTSQIFIARFKMPEAG
jgi:dipeptidyl aminopeptidase/acylaminoacyl peptidase